MHYYNPLDMGLFAPNFEKTLTRTVRGFKVSKVLLYAIEGALIGSHWNELDDDYKQRLLNEVKQHHS